MRKQRKTDSVDCWGGEAQGVLALVTRHADASHFWLNEGWTTYIERLLKQILHCLAHQGFSFLTGAKDLYDDLKFYELRNKKYRKLRIEFEKGENPDDTYSSVPYDKGANFLLHIGFQNGH
ncbi:hypothetical protein DEU56DRAFT_915344 [Suillus clintonianus]|uniref:uncharacterized protein n=1 Tax=Suillus clintonianus TaxID=1904413 RepID=UPI001B881641|nr:uncharacterized protein DEU56DRAFT_915344 [Suillus clintonianus]KAG2129029.1 hypothetical protein DEU56DRAFT_915344 [Suillus clintonianus]